MSFFCCGYHSLSSQGYADCFCLPRDERRLFYALLLQPRISCRLMCLILSSRAKRVLRLLWLSFIRAECCDSHLEINSEITSNIVWLKISVSQQTLWIASSHSSLSSLSHALSVPPFSPLQPPHFILSFYLYLLFPPLHPPSHCLPPFFSLTHTSYASPPLSLTHLLIPPLHPNLNSLKPSIRLHNKLLPLQARQGSSLPVAFCLSVSAGMFVCVCVLCLLASLLVSFHPCVCASRVQVCVCVCVR